MSDMNDPQQRAARIRLPTRRVAIYNGDTFTFESEADRAQYETVMRLAIKTQGYYMQHIPDSLTHNAGQAAYAVGGTVEFVDQMPPMPDGTVY